MGHKLPGHISSSSRSWAESVLDEFEATASQVRLVIAAAEAWDRAQQARRAISRDGAYWTDRLENLRPHPGLAVERESRAAFARIVGQLGPDAADDPEERRRPSTPGPNPRARARARGGR
jgi:hypothetical protein